MALPTDIRTGDTGHAKLHNDANLEINRVAANLPGRKVSVPSGFSMNALPVPDVHRLGGGRFFVDTDAYVAALRPPAGQTFWVGPEAVAGSGTGGSASSPGTVLEALANPEVGTIMYLPGEYPRTFTTTSTTRSLNHIAAGPGVRITSYNNPGSTTWTLHAPNVYKTSRSNTLGVLDVKTRTSWGDFTKYLQKPDAASVTGPGQYAVVGSDVYVWAIDNVDLTVSANRYNIRLCVSANTGVMITGGVSYIQNIAFEGFIANGSGLSVAGTGLAIAEDCQFKYGMGATNGVNVNSGRGTVLVRCEASSNDLDGFNYHGTGSVMPDFLEFYCRSHHNGLQNPGSNNATTAHEAVKGVRVGGVYDMSGGPVVADVNNAKSWNLGCEAGESTATNGGSWRAEASTVTSDKAQIWLDECRSSGTTPALRATGGARIHLHGFRSTNAALTSASDVDGFYSYY